MRNPFRDGGPLDEVAAAGSVLAVSAVLLTVQVVGYPDAFNLKAFVGSAAMGLISFGVVCRQVTS